MPSGFLPTKDATLLAFAQNFSTLITAAPTTYGLVVGQATALAALVTAFQTSLAACEPGVRNKAAVFTKNTARTNLKTSVRLLAKIIEGQATVTNAQKAALGLNVRSAPTPIPPPALPPQVDVVSVVGRTVKVRLHNAETSPRRGKPANVKGAALFSFVGASAPSDPGLYKFEGNTTLTTVDVGFPATVAPGATVWITAIWFNERAQSGPPATPVSAVIQYGMSMVA